MAYTIIKSDGTTLTTIPDGTINTTSTSLGLPGRNYAGYGQTLDTNFVHIMESFADTTPPPNPIRGQLWFNTSANTLYVCPADGTSNANAWLALTSTSNGGGATFGSVSVTGNLSANNLSAVTTITAAQGTFTNISASGNANIVLANITTAIIGTANTQLITTGANTTAGNLIGTWTANGGLSGNAFVVTNGNLYIAPGASNLGIRTDYYYYANGTPISFAGTYGNSNVAAYLPTYTGNVGTGATVFTGTTLTTGANGTAGSITGNWTLTTGSRFNATYADLAERFEADQEYDAGTLMEIGGLKEITSVKIDLSDKVFGVISNTAAYLMNQSAGDDKTHPAIALSGRVKVKVIGPVTKGDRLVSAGNGHARAGRSEEVTPFNTFGRALENKDSDGEGLIEAVVMIK